MKVVLVHPSKVVPYARNHRKNQASIVKVAASIREFGWRQPIVVDSEMVIVVGHTRYLAAMQLEWRVAFPGHFFFTSGMNLMYVRPTWVARKGFKGRRCESVVVPPL